MNTENEQSIWHVTQQMLTENGWINLLSDSWSILFKILIILLLSFLILRIRQRVIDQIFHITKLDEKREQTLASLLMSLSRYVVYIIATLTILKALNIDLTPILAGAGIAGLAIGFGAQSLVKDIITGFFIMFEDQFHVGDFIEINGKISGTVEELGLRMTVIREWGGHVNYLANSEIKRVKNYNRQKMRSIVSVTVPYEQDFDKVSRVIEEMCNKMAVSHREHFLQENGQLVEPPQLYGVVDLENGALGAKYTITALVKDDSYWLISKELRRLLLKELNQNEIHISYPKRIYTRNVPTDDALNMEEQ